MRITGTISARILAPLIALAIAGDADAQFRGGMSMNMGMRMSSSVSPRSMGGNGSFPRQNGMSQPGATNGGFPLQYGTGFSPYSTGMSWAPYSMGTYGYGTDPGYSTGYNPYAFINSYMPNGMGAASSGTAPSYNGAYQTMSSNYAPSTRYWGPNQLAGNYRAYPPLEVVREQQESNRLDRARGTPPTKEIASGESLNVLLASIQRNRAKSIDGEGSIPLDPEVVKNINVTPSGSNDGSNEFFKSSFPEWPVVFEGDSFAAGKKKIEMEVAAQTTLQKGGQLDGAKADDLRRTVQGMKEQLFELRNQASFTNYVAALEFLSKLNDMINVLGNPGATAYLDGTIAAKGNTVAELADYMITNDLKFAKASAGSEKYYVRLHRQLLTYELQLKRLAGERG